MQEAEEMGIHELILGGIWNDYEEALGDWSCYADPCLQDILDTAQTYLGIEAPQPALLPVLSILGLVLLPALLRRRWAGRRTSIRYRVQHICGLLA
jgi:hypothetical protein